MNSKRDVIIVLILGVLLMVLFVAIEAAELLYEFSRDYEELELDEFLIALPPWAFLFGWYAWRRWRESNEMLEYIHYKASVDYLTGVHNRKSFDKKIRREVERAHRYDGMFAMMMVDLDHFKEINDRFGHVVGDEVLMRIGSLLKERFRKVDFIGRYGGEEFAIILPQTDLPNAERVADELLQILRDKPIPIQNGAKDIKVTASIGVGFFSQHDLYTPEEFIDKCDQALYRAKNQGRDQVCVAH